MFVRSFFALFLLAAPALATDMIYVSVAGEKRIAIYHVNASDGKLTPAGDIKTTGEPGALIADPKRRFLFAALRSTGELASFRIDKETGKLSHLNTVPAGADPAHISTDKAGKFLFTAYYVAGQVTVHDIKDDGSLSTEPRQTVKTKEKAHAIVLEPWEFAAFVPHTGPNVIYLLPWVGKELLPPGKSVFAAGLIVHETPKDTGPRHVIFHPTLNFNGGVDLIYRVAYVANEQGGSVTMYHTVFNPLNWGVEEQQTLSTLPSDFKGINACAEIRLHPSNRLLYVSNRGHDSIAGFALDEKTGRMTRLGQTPTEKTPRSFDIDPSGRYLFAAGESSGCLAGYRIDEASGKLERIATYDVGKMPWWVMAVRLPGK